MIRTICFPSLLVLAGAWVIPAQPAGAVRAGGSSPRIEELKRRVSTGDSAVVAAFWATLGREHAPIIEPFPGDEHQVLATLVWRGGPATRSVQVAGNQMAHIPSTDVWYATLIAPSDYRFAYSFKTDGNASPQPDPLNPHRLIAPIPQERPASAVNKDSPYINSSIALMPQAPDSPWVDLRLGVAAGRVEEASYPSKIYGGVRRVWIYDPPGDGTPAGLVVCLWGRDYLNEIPTPTILDNLLSEHKIPRLVAVFAETDNDRFQNFQVTRKFADSFATELLPWIRGKERIPADPRRIIVAGYSAAGLAATFVAFQHPELAGNVLAQSGAFWRGFDGEGASEYEWLAARYAAGPVRQTRFYLHVGAREDRRAGGSGPVFREANQRLRDVLVKRGYAVSYDEVPGAEHEFIHWRSKFGDGLVYLTSGW